MKGPRTTGSTSSGSEEGSFVRVRIDRARIRAHNAKLALDHGGVWRILGNSIRVGVVNATAAGVAELANTYLEAKGLNSRRITLLVTPNPEKGRGENPMKNPLHS